MKRSVVLLLVVLMLFCVSCKSKEETTSTPASETTSQTESASSKNSKNASNNKENASSKKSSTGEKTQKNEPIEREKAVSIAKGLIEHYETYVNMGIACDLDSTNNLPQEDLEAMWNQLSEEQQGYLAARARKCKCCKTYEEAKNHLYRLFDPGIIKYISNDYVVYKGNLYFFMGAKGFISYENVVFMRYENDGFVVSADEYGSGDNYCGTVAFSFRKEGTGYVLNKIEA